MPDFRRMQAFSVALAESSALASSASPDGGAESSGLEVARGRTRDGGRRASKGSDARSKEEREAKLVERAAVAVAKARAGHQRYRAIFEALGVPSLLSNASGEVFRMNRAARGLLGLEGVTILRRPIERLFEPVAAEQLGRALARIESEPLTLHSRLAIGSREAVLVHARSTGTKEIFWTLSADASVREANLARRLADKDEVIDRQRKMIEALQRDSRAKDKFIAVLGHDLRAPLNAVLGWTQLMRREPLDSVGRERALATIERNARSQAALIEELLDVTRLNEGRLALEISACDIALVVRRTIEATLPEASSRGVRLITQLQSGVTVAGDRSRLEQIINNLVSNALKFTPPGGSVQVSVAREGAHARIEVRDTGKGIAAAQLPHVFKWLNQGGDARPTREGLGLGLFIVRRLVELHGGSVSAASDGPGRGATFTVVLPHCDPGIASAPSMSRNAASLRRSSMSSSTWPPHSTLYAMLRMWSESRYGRARLRIPSCWSIASGSPTPRTRSCIAGRPPHVTARTRSAISYLARGASNSGEPGFFGSLPPMSGASRAMIFRFSRSSFRPTLAFT
jgi:signal transduction histidine kinase